MECFLLWVEHHPGLASWVQAIGSIAALILAFAVVFVQHHLSVASAKQNARRDDVAVVLALKKLALGIRAALASALSVIAAEIEFNAYRKTAKSLSDYDEIFQFLPIDRLVMHDLSAQYLALRSIARDSSNDFRIDTRNGGLIVNANADWLLERIGKCDEIITEIDEVAFAIK
jgi:hypothetical protein